MKKTLMMIAFLVGFSAQAQKSPVATLVEFITGENASEAVSGMQLNRLENGNVVFNLCTSTQDCSTVTGSPEGYSKDEQHAQLRQAFDPSDKAVILELADLENASVDMLLEVYKAYDRESVFAKLATFVFDAKSDSELSGVRFTRLENGNVVFNLCTSTQDCSTVTGSPEGYSQQELQVQLKQMVRQSRLVARVAPVMSIEKITGATKRAVDVSWEKLKEAKRRIQATPLPVRKTIEDVYEMFTGSSEAQPDSQSKE